MFAHDIKAEMCGSIMQPAYRHVPGTFNLTRSPFQNTDKIVTNRDFSLVGIMINNILQVPPIQFV